MRECNVKSDSTSAVDAIFKAEGLVDGSKIAQGVPETMKEKCEKIIRTAAIACGGVGTGFAQLPLADSAIITPIQVAMIINIGKVYGRDITDSMATAIIGSLSSALTGRCISAVMFGWVPIIGNVVNTVTAAGLTAAIGHLAVKKFADEGYLKNLDCRLSDS